MANLNQTQETTNSSKVEEIIDHLLDRNDGPVTPDVVGGRAWELTKSSSYTGEQIGQAMYEALCILRDNGGYLSTNERLHY